MRAVLITGVSGFVGGAVARHLLRAGTYDEVWGLARRDPHITGLHFVAADITDPATLPTHLIYADVVHAAGFAADGWDATADAVNRAGTVHMLRVSPGGRFIHISSSSVYDLSHDSHLLPETAFNANTYRFYNAYGESKARAEVLVQNSVLSRHVPPTILRPHAVYGPGDNHLLPRLTARINHGRLMLPDGGKHMHALTHIDNLVQAVTLALTITPVDCEAYNITDLEPIALATAIGLSVPQPPRIRGISTANLLFLSSFLPWLSEYEIRQVGFERTYDISRAQRDLGYTPTRFVRPLV